MPPSKETPKKIRSSTEKSYTSPDVDERRKALIEEIGSVPEVDFDVLIDTVLVNKWKKRESLPLLTKNEVSQTIVNLEANQILKNGRWEGFETDPSGANTLEDATFEPLEQLFDSIVDASHLAQTNLLRLAVQGNKAPVSDTRSDSAVPDGYLILKNSSLPTELRPVDPKTVRSQPPNYLDSVSDIPVLFEFKKKENAQTVRDDIKKILWSMHHCMRNDARRRFVFGLTIENTTLRLWYYDRSAVVVSTAINWIKDTRQFVRLVLGFAACSELQDLGYDPSIRRIGTITRSTTLSEPEYEIDVHKDPTSETKTFVTRKLISDAGADSFIGRGTRVWIVVRKNDQGPDLPEYILKDCWIDSDREREGRTLEAVRKIDLLAPNNPAGADLRLSRNNFLRLIAHGVVLIAVGKSQELDATLLLHRGGVIIDSTQNFDLTLRSNSGPSTKSYTSSQGLLLQPPAVGVGGVPRSTFSKNRSGQLIDLHRDLQHYRIVLEGVGTPFQELASFQDIFSTLRGAVKALDHLSRCEYVHRDVSITNILSYKDEGVLIDLEYAKPFSAETEPHVFATGTPQFMSAEVAKQRYLFVQENQAKALLAGAPAWRHNPLHDLDSIWWIAVWATLNFIGPDTQRTDTDTDNFIRLFADPKDRDEFLLDPVTACEDVEFSYHQELWQALCQWRAELSALFAEYEAALFRGAEPKTPFLPAFEMTLATIDKLLQPGGEAMSLGVHVSCRPM